MGTNEARQWEERVEEPLPRFLPPPSSPETAYLEMRLRLAKQSAEEEAEMGTRFVVRFSSKSDAFYENPVRGGTYRIKAGLPYVDEFQSLAGCSALGQASQAARYASTPLSLRGSPPYSVSLTPWRSLTQRRQLAE